MRIAFVVPSLGPNEGQGSVDLVILRALSEVGHEVHVFAGNAPADVAAMPRVTLTTLPRVRAWQWGNQLLGLGTTALRLRRARYDVVHADAAIAGARADVLVVHTVTARWLALPQDVWREPGIRGANEAAATRFKAALELRQARRARHVVANSAMTADDLAAAGVDRARITIVPFGVDASRFRPPSAGERAGARMSLGLDGTAFVVGFVGPLGPRKGFPLVIDALAGSDAVLLAAGDQRGHRIAEARGRGVDVVAPGKLDEVRAAYWAADVLAYPSRYDAFGMAVLEAMGCGLPVIVSPETGSHDLVGDAGIVLERTDAASLRAAIDRMRDSDELRAAMGHRAREIALARPWDETGASIIKLYSRLG